MKDQVNLSVLALTFSIVKNGQRPLIIIPCEAIHLWDVQVPTALKEMETDKSIEQQQQQKNIQSYPSRKRIELFLM